MFSLCILVFFKTEIHQLIFCYYYYVTLTPREHDVILFTYTSKFENNKNILNKRLIKSALFKYVQKDTYITVCNELTD